MQLAQWFGGSAARCARGLLPAVSALLLASAWFTPASAQQGTVGGVVISAQTQAPIEGASVLVEGTRRGMMTNAEGRFLLPGLTGSEVALRVTMIGYRGQLITARPGDMDLRIELSETAIELDRIVVTGTAGGETKRSLGNSITTVDASELLEKAPISNVSQLLNGRAPGVAIINSTGMVGGGARVRMRGSNSFSLSGDPLIYIDGVRVNNDQNTGPINQAFGSRSISRWNDLNPEDIESIEVLKGPAAATLYGTEAAAGVIQIITRRGRTGTPRLSISTKQGSQWFANPQGRLWTNYYDVGSNGSIETIDMVELEESRGNQIWRTGRVQEYDLSLSGGAELIRYYVSGNFENTQGIEPDNSVRRWGGRANITAVPNDDWEVNASLGYVNGRTNLALEAGGGGSTWSTYFARPDRDAPVTIGGQQVPNPRRGFWSYTPEAYRDGFDSWQDIDRTTAGITLNHRPAAWFSQRLTAGYDHTRQQDNEIMHHDERYMYFSSFFDRGYREMWEHNIRYATIDYNGTVTLPLRADLESSSSIGGQLYQRKADVVYAYGEGFPTPGLTSIDATTQGFETGQNLVENVTVGVFFQEQLSWKNRLFLTAAIRGDDNSSFGEEFDFVTYPKVSAAWVISEEPFWSFTPVNTLKLRLAYGESGQQPEAFTATRTLAPATGPNDAGTVTPQNIGNPNLGPERGAEIEAGFDLAFLNDRLGLEFTYYDQTTTDAILLREIAPSTGFAGNQYVNAGEIKNRGIEALLRAEPWRTEQHGLQLMFNISTNDNEVVSLGDIGYEDSFGDTYLSAGTYMRHQVGYPVGSWFSRRVTSATLDANNKATNLMCDNGNGGEVACAGAPEIYLGRTVPEVEGGFNATLTLFKNVRLFGQLDFKRGYTKLDGNYRVRCYFYTMCRENWFPQEFDPAKIAEIQAAGPYVSALIDDASYTKLREVSLAYQLPDNWAQRFGARTASVTVAGRNLYTWSGYMGLEPEAFFAGGSRGGSHSAWEQNTLPQLAQVVLIFNVGM